MGPGAEKQKQECLPHIIPGLTWGVCAPKPLTLGSMDLVGRFLKNVFTSGDGRALFHFKPNLLLIPFKSFMPKDEPARKKPSNMWGDLPNHEERKGQGAVDRKRRGEHLRHGTQRLLGTSLGAPVPK